MVILFVIVLVIVFVCLTVHASWEWSDWLSGLFSLLAVGIVIAGFWSNFSVCNIPTSRTTVLYAGYNNTEINGQFFLGSGSVDEKDMVYYWINDNGVKSKHSKNMDDSVFIEDGKNVMVEKFHTCPVDVNWLFLDNSFEKVEFHVPENSIVQMYQYH